MRQAASFDRLYRQLRMATAALLFLCGTVHAQADRLVDELPFYAFSLIGTPYKYGGNNPETGLDCSGFVGHVFQRMAGIQLPRDSQTMSRLGTPLEVSQLQPGDLVFFNTLGRAFSHVGVYVGENRFVHASSSKTGSVMLSDMSQSYWNQRFDGARRLVGNPPEP